MNVKSIEISRAHVAFISELYMLVRGMPFYSIFEMPFWDDFNMLLESVVYIPVGQVCCTNNRKYGEWKVLHVSIAVSFNNEGHLILCWLRSTNLLYSSVLNAKAEWFIAGPRNYGWTGLQC